MITAKPSSPQESTVSHLHSFVGARGYTKGIELMSAEAKSDACAKQKGSDLFLLGRRVMHM
jgi:hypothetical protein